MRLEHLDAKDRLGLSHRAVYEPAMTAYAKRSIKPGMIVVDVGAHIGYYTTLMSRLVGPSGRVIAFEPEPENYRILRLNTDGLGNVGAYPFAVSDEAGSASLYLNPRNSGDHRLCRVEGWERVETTAITLDGFQELAGCAVGFLKIDAQGSETRILRGGVGTIARSPHLKGIIEVAPRHLALAGSSVAELLRVCESIGLQLDANYRSLLKMKLHTTVAMHKVSA